MNNLYSLALEKSEQTPEVVLMLSNILRYSLYEAEVSAASLEREIEILHSYIALQEIGIGERVRKDASDGGIGLDNLRGRLQLLYPHRHRLSIGPGDGIFRVALTVAGEPS